MTQQFLAMAKKVSEEVVTEIRQNPDKIYFPFFGEGDNILKNGFKLDKVMFTIPGTDFIIYWYGFLIAVGLLLALIYGFKRMKTVGIDPDRATDAVIGGFIGAVIGARLYYVIFSIENYSTATGGLDFKEIINFRDGGLAIYGGIIGAILVGGIIAKIRKLKVTAILDIAGPCFLIGQAVGRWGNFFNQEAFGGNTTLPWGMMSNRTIEYLASNYDSIEGTVDNFLPVHPCFLYESLWCIIGFVLLHFYLRHRKFDGEVFLMYIGWYGLGRFFIEGLRSDSLYFGQIRVSQLIAGTCVLASLLLIVVFRSMLNRNPDYVLYCDTELSKEQLAEYNAYEEINAKKKEIKVKIADAKAKGESTVELEKQLSSLKKEITEKNKKDVVKEEKEEYKNIIDDDDEYVDEIIVHSSDDDEDNSEEFAEDDADDVDFVEDDIDDLEDDFDE
ncbi:MAG: prolipoprotein diacylglyceryl transferase [Ruminococcus sp.]|nr:prolipoprotein diacylglyceryl transferase [Ruminococcus sp.]